MRERDLDLARDLVRSGEIWLNLAEQRPHERKPCAHDRQRPAPVDRVLRFEECGI